MTPGSAALIASLDTLPEVEGVELVQDEDDLLVWRDTQGRAWSTGWFKGQRVKIRRRSFEAERHYSHRAKGPA